MATETGPDLTGARAAVERLMDDTCEVLRPSVLDADGIAAAAVVVPEGPCMVTDDGGNEERTADAYTFSHRASLPVNPTTDLIEEGDVVRMLTSRRDQALPGMLLVVREVPPGTFLVSRRLRLTRWEALVRDHHDEPTPWDQGGL